MTVEIYVVLDPKGDRPYVSTTRPSDERLRSLEEQGCEVWLVPAHIPSKRLPVAQVSKGAQRVVPPSLP